MANRVLTTLAINRNSLWTGIVLLLDGTVSAGIIWIWTAPAGIVLTLLDGTVSADTGDFKYGVRGWCWC